MADQSNKVNPLDWKTPIVNKDGTPTNEFMRKWAQQAAANGSIPGAITTPQELSDLLDILGADQGDLLFRAADRWHVLTAGTDGFVLKTSGAGANPAWVALPNVQELLDTITTTNGSMIYRDPTGNAWEALAPTTHDGWVLTWDNTAGIPKWAASSGGGGGVIIGSGAPSALEPAGTIYSRSDAAEAYSSTPTVTGGAVRQSFAYISGNNTPGAITIGGAPVVGSLILAYVGWGNATNAAPTWNTSGWTLAHTVNSPDTGGAIAGALLYRYAQVGDTATLPALATAGSSYWAAEIFEIQGVTGTFATDVPVIQDFNARGNSETAGPLTTTVAGQIVVIAATQYHATANPTNGTAGWTADAAANNGSNFGNAGGWHQSVPISGTAVSAALGSNAGSSYCFSGIIAAVTVSTTTSAHWTLITPPPGGTSGQVLTKNTNADGDYSWQNSGGGGGGYPAGTPPTVVQVGHSNSGMSVVLGANPTNGNLLVAMVFNPSSDSAASGWTKQVENSSGTDYGIILTKVAGAGESATQNPISSNPGGSCTIWELHGQAASNFFVGGASQTEFSGNSNSPLIFPAAKDCIGLWATGGTAGAISKIVAGGTTDVNDSTLGTRNTAAGHTDLSQTPTVGGIVLYSTSNNNKSASCLITS